MGLGQINYILSISPIQLLSLRFLAVFTLVLKSRPELTLSLHFTCFVVSSDTQYNGTGNSLFFYWLPV